MRPAALSSALLLAFAATAAAQDEDPAVRAVREQEALRERQTQGIRRAEERTYSPLTSDSMVSPALQASGTSSPSSAPRPGPLPQRLGFLPWAIAAVGVLMFALLGWAVLRRNRQ